MLPKLSQSLLQAALSTQEGGKLKAMSYAQAHFRSAVYALATGEGPILDRLRIAADSLEKAADFNLGEVPMRLRAEFLELREELSTALKAGNYDGAGGGRLAERIVKLYEDIHDDPATH